MKYKALLSTIAATTVLGLASQPAAAVEKGDLLLRFGLANVSPNDGSTGVVPDDAVGVEDDTQAFVNLTWMFTDNLGLDVLGATPFSHDITLNGSGKIGETKQLPPTVGLQYHFTPESAFRPYVGAGINYTIFFSEDATNVISSLSLDDSVGLALQAGVDVEINPDWFFNADLRYMDIETTANTDLGEIDVDIDPWVFSLGVGTRF